MKKNNKFRILLMLLSLVLIVGSLAVLFPANTAVDGECGHIRARVVSKTLSGNTRKTVYVCDFCGKELTKEAEVDSFANYQPQVNEGSVVYAGNWSVGWVTADVSKFTEYTGLENGNVDYLTTDGNPWGETGYGGYRLTAWHAGCYGVSLESSRYPAICYTAQNSTVLALDVSQLWPGQNPYFQIYKNNTPLFSEWQRLGSGDWVDAESAREVLTSMRVPVSRGDKLLFVCRPANASVTETKFWPIVEDVGTPWTVMSCSPACSYKANGVCEECGTVRAVKNFMLNLNSEYGYAETIEFVEGMTWREMQYSVFAHERVLFGYFIGSDMLVGIKSGMNDTTIYCLLKDGHSVRPSDVIDPAGNYTWLEL